MSAESWMTLNLRARMSTKGGRYHRERGAVEIEGLQFPVRIDFHTVHIDDRRSLSILSNTHFRPIRVEAEYGKWLKAVDAAIVAGERVPLRPLSHMRPQSVRLRDGPVALASGIRNRSVKLPTKPRY